MKENEINEILKRDDYECQKCKSEGRFNIAQYVKGINDNFISLCGKCYEEVTQVKNNEKIQIDY